MPEFALPSKIVPALRRLSYHYEKRGKGDLRELILSSRVYVRAETEFDRWNGGTWGHDVLIFVPEERMRLVDLDRQSEIFEEMRLDLGKATSEVENEYVRSVVILAFDEADAEYQASIPLSGEPQTNPAQVGLWAENALRVFISHRDEDKRVAHKLASTLKPYGVSCFVAHDAIKPMKEWQREIQNGLATMEVMLVLLTDAFHSSSWTNQEVGFALGKNIPIVCIKLGTADPQGFIGARQAIKSDPSAIESSRSELLKALLGEVHQAGRIKDILIESFIHSESYIDTMESLKRLSEVAERLTDRDFYRIVKGYRENNQLNTCVGIHNRGNWFKRYLESATGKRIEIENRQISEKRDSGEDSI